MPTSPVYEWGVQSTVHRSNLLEMIHATFVQRASILKRLTICIILAAGCARLACADLQPRLGGAALYDTDLNITWLANMNLAATNTFGTPGVIPDGSMSWPVVVNWIAAMNHAKYLGFSTWRLPAEPVFDPACSGQNTNPTSSAGYNCTGSEMGHLFYDELGGVANASILNLHNYNFDLFTNPSGWNGNNPNYWTSTAWPAPLNPNDHFAFQFGTGAVYTSSGPIFALPVLTGDVAASSVLPQFAFGGGWYSAIYFTNRGDNAVSFPLNFISDSGTPLLVPALSGTSTTVNLAGHATALIEAPNTGALSQGYVSLSLPQGVEAYGVFRVSAAGAPDQEAVVPLSSAFSTGATLMWDDTHFVTSIAIVNPNAVATTVNITVRDVNGVVIGQTSIPLAAGNKAESVMRNIPGLSSMAGNRGSADFTVTSGFVAVLGLRSDGLAITSIPTAQK